MRKSGGKWIRSVLPLIIQALNACVFFELPRAARILAATMVAMFVLLFLIDAHEIGQA
jgi:hypothetical protein